MKRLFSETIARSASSDGAKTCDGASKFAAEISKKTSHVAMDKRHYFINSYSSNSLGSGEQEEKSTREEASTIIRKVCESLFYRILLTMIIIANMVTGVIETDTRAAQKGTPFWLTACNFTMLSIYILDIVLRVAASGYVFFRDSFNMFDLFVVTLDAIVSIGFSLVKPVRQSQASVAIACLRGLRMLRTFRVLRNFLMFRELYIMMQGFAGAVRTLLFGLALVFVVLTSWSILAVEVLHPLNEALVEAGIYVECDRCQRAFESVMTSNLTFIKTIIAGDSWGQVSIPLMEKSPMASVLLISVFVTLQWGLMNIITAVIVDSQAAARAQDQMLTAVLKKENLHESYTRLLNLFMEMDHDGSGTLTLGELQRNYKCNPEFREILNLMDITFDNMGIFFEIMDVDESGGVGYEEFVRQLHTIKTFDSHTLLIFIRHLVNCNTKQMQNYFEQLDKKMSVIVGNFDRNQPKSQSPCSNIADPYRLFPEDDAFAGDVVSRGPEKLQPVQSSINEDARALQPTSPEYDEDVTKKDLQTVWYCLTSSASAPETQVLIAKWYERLQTDFTDIAAYSAKRVAVAGVQKHSQEELSEIAAYASKKIAVSGEWLQSATSLMEAGMDSAGIAKVETSSCDNAWNPHIGKSDGDARSTEQFWRHCKGDPRCQSTSETHMRPHVRKPKQVSAQLVINKRSTPRKPDAETLGNL